MFKCCLFAFLIIISMKSSGGSILLEFFWRHFYSAGASAIRRSEAFASSALGIGAEWTGGAVLRAISGRDGLGFLQMRNDRA